MESIAIVIKTLQEQIENIEQKQEQYKIQCSELPKGVVFVKKRIFNDSVFEYCTLDYYCPEKKRGTSKYLGKDKSVIPIIQAQIDERKHLEKVVIKNLKAELDALNKLLDTTQKLLQKESVRGKLKEPTAEQGTIEINQSQITIQTTPRK